MKVELFIPIFSIKYVGLSPIILMAFYGCYNWISESEHRISNALYIGFSIVGGIIFFLSFK